MARQRWWRWFGGATIALVFIIAAEYSVGWRSLLAPWLRLPLTSLIAIVALILVSYGLRALRLQGQFSTVTHGHFGRCLCIVLWHNAINHLLPLRSGEVALPLLLQRLFGLSLTAATGALLWWRLLDLYALLGSVALLLLLDGIIVLNGLGYGAVALLFGAGPWLGWRLGAWGLARLRGGFWQRLRLGLPQNSRAFWRCWGLTIATWLAKLAAFCWFLQLMTPLTLAQSALGAAAGELTSVLPLHGVAGLGSYEAGVMAALLPLGVAVEAALHGAVNLHLLLLGLALVTALLAWLGWQRRRPQQLLAP